MVIENNRGTILYELTHMSPLYAVIMNKTSERKVVKPCKLIYGVLTSKKVTRLSAEEFVTDRQPDN